MRMEAECITLEPSCRGIEPLFLILESHFNREEAVCGSVEAVFAQESTKRVWQEAENASSLAESRIESAERGYRHARGLPRWAENIAFSSMHLLPRVSLSQRVSVRLQLGRKGSNLNFKAPFPERFAPRRSARLQFGATETIGKSPSIRA